MWPHRKKPSFELSCVYIHDEETNSYSAHFEQFPDTYAHGESKEEAFRNLCKALISVLKFEAQEANSVQERRNRNITRQSFRLEFA